MRRRLPLHWWLLCAAVVVVIFEIVILPYVLAQHLEVQTAFYALGAISLALILAAFVELRFVELNKKIDRLQRRIRRKRTF